MTPKPKVSRRSIVDVPEFDLTRGNSDEELVPLDSPGSEVEFEESIAGEEVTTPVSEEEFPDVPDVRAAVLRAAFKTLDDVDPCHQFRQRAAVMKSVPKIFQGLFRNALKVALKEIIEGAGEVEQERGMEAPPHVAENIVASPLWVKQSLKIQAQSQIRVIFSRRLDRFDRGLRAVR